MDPLTAPQPTDETGLNSHFRSTFAPQSPTQSTSNPNTVQRSKSLHTRKPLSPTASTRQQQQTTARARGHSLGERFPGDMSHRPLMQIKRDNRAAQRSPHLRKGSLPHVDQVDSLDRIVGSMYHHEGPYDAALASRNSNPRASPLAALENSNLQALRATPMEHIMDSLHCHRPLDGVASVPPHSPDRYGRLYDYEEIDVVKEAGGDYKKYTGEVSNVVCVPVQVISDDTFS